MIIDGKLIAQSIVSSLKAEVGKLSFKPVFCDILVGNDPASAQYVRMKGQKALSVGLAVHKAEFPAEITTEQLIAEIKKLDEIPNMCGLIAQLPLPLHIDRQAVLNAIDPNIDVDVIGEVNSQKFYSGDKNALQFPTAAAVIRILQETKLDLTTKNVLVMGYGQLVGRPVSFLLEQMGCKVTVARSKTENVEDLLQAADVIVSAVGKPKLITGEKIKPGAVVVDAGTAESEGGIVGDVDFESVSSKASYVSPVPGGVGPVTVAMLLNNVLKAAKLKNTSL